MARCAKEFVNRLLARYLIAAVFLFALGLYNFATYTSSSSLQSTINILSGQYEYSSTTRNSGDTVSGSFQEISGRPVNFVIMTSAEFASFQAGNFTGLLYSIRDTPSGSVSYSFTTQDTFYLLFLHGSGFLNTVQTVTFQRTYTAYDQFHFGLGLLFMALAVVAIAFGLRKRNLLAATTPSTFPASPSGSQSPTSTPGPQPVSIVCTNCGEVVGGPASFCPNCGSRVRVEHS